MGVPGVLLDGGRAVVVGDGVTLPDGGLAVGVTVRVVGVRLGGGTDAVVVGVTVGGGVLVRVGVLVGGTEAVGVAVGGRCVLVGVTVGLGGGVSVVRVRVDVGVAVGRVPVAKLNRLAAPVTIPSHSMIRTEPTIEGLNSQGRIYKAIK